MAVVRPELTPNEMDWIVGWIKQAPREELHEHRRAVKELKRAQTQVHAIQANEIRQLEKLRAALPTAPREDTE